MKLRCLRAAEAAMPSWAKALNIMTGAVGVGYGLIWLMEADG
jgi:hypothetical protein